MGYTYKDAILALMDYLPPYVKQIGTVANTNERGILCEVNDEKCVIFISPIGCKQGNKQNWVDLRDSGRNERIAAWRYAHLNDLKYFHLCVNSEQDRYKDYIFSIENSEEKISDICFRTKNGIEGTGTQANIPNSFIPHKNFERFQTEKGFVFAVSHKSYIENYLISFDNRPYSKDPADETHLLKAGNESLFNSTDDLDESNNSGLNLIYYGTPGCGKSYLVKQEWERKPEIDDDDDCKPFVRTTFYPDYSNSDFVGQIIPSLDDFGTPTYEFVDGPFTKALIKAFNNPDKEIALIIEELNRGNAAAIFGEIFQLLDRDETGESQYRIYNSSIIKEINKKVEEDKQPDGGFGTVYIPSNLSIIATMNTSDQNVYPLDTAFQRRWKFKKIRNSFLKEGVELTSESLDNPANFISMQAYNLSKMFIPGEKTTWMDFVNDLNKRIVSNKDTSYSSEDKQIGVYFLSEDELCEEEFSDDEEAKKAFAEKMLKYIWEDIAKLDPEEWFPNSQSLDDVIEDFRENGLSVFKDGIIPSGV